MRAERRESARYWTSDLLPGGELLTATFREQRFSRHWHETYVIPVIQAGAQGYWYRGGHHTATPGTIAAINPGEVHTGERATRDGWVYRAFYPSTSWMSGLASAIAGRLVPAPSFPDATIFDPLVAGRLVSAHTKLERGADPLEAEIALHSAFALLLQRYARSGVDPAPESRDQKRVRTMQVVLSQELNRPITLTELAASVGLSPFHAARLFTKATGIPPHAWRNQLRITRAVGLLRAGKSVADAAASVGFFDQSHFTRCFRRVYGVPPGTLTKAIQHRGT
ncbi:MAG TPA: AraC family transcriptional regulator [Vicinamibacterales bacterium]|nr:AraC family transcriptional regulator [Vicinamibacterales bacterium]